MLTLEMAMQAATQLASQAAAQTDTISAAQEGADVWLLQGVDPEAVWLPGALILGTFASEDLTCIAAGLLAAAGSMPFVTAALSCALGIFLGDLGLYALGRAASAGLLRWDWVRRRMPLDGGASRFRKVLDDRGVQILLASRFLPGTRLPTYLLCGALGWSFRRFAGALALGALIWTPLVVGVAMGAGNIAVLNPLGSGPWAWVGLVFAVLGVWIVIRVLAACVTWRGRRLLLSRWRRLTRWEYWPTSLVYIPVAVSLSFRWAVKERFFTGDPCLFSACNPGIPHGGIVDESKSDILDQLPSSPQDDEALAVARYERLQRSQPIAERLAVVERFLRDGRAVLKPDMGERGDGVAVVRNLGEARAWLEACPQDGLVQEFVGGPEFGVVWRRLPERERVPGGPIGEIRSIAQKQPPTVVGDGVRSLRDVILADDRQVAMARYHLGRLTIEELDSVPAHGESISLGALGSHCRGATFLDARPMESESLLAAVNGFMAHASGLDFGRFDVRVPSSEDFRAGVGIRVLEFNGVTGEPAHIYQPGYSWWQGAKDLCRHWWAASRNGAENRDAGHRPTSGFRLIRLALRSRSSSRFEVDDVLPGSVKSGRIVPRIGNPDSVSEPFSTSL